MSMPLIPRRELKFQLHDWLRVDALLHAPRFAAHSAETFDAVMDGCDRLAAEVFAPCYQAADRDEPHFDGENVSVHPQIAEAVRAFAVSGLVSATEDESVGGMQLPVVVEKAALVNLYAANIGACAYPLLTMGNARLLLAHGTPAQVDAFAMPQLRGDWTGTMCLSEPQAGSSLSDITTRAEYERESPFGPQYRISGRKMWISGGEHEILGNIVHLVLAKVPDADGKLPAGTRGISLFIVPRSLVDADGNVGERNDVSLAGLNHKLGYRATVNCALNFGEGRFKPEGRAGAIGYLVGKPGEGLAGMFHMMNDARIGVGLGAVALGYAGYLLALDYARNRPQGRLPGPAGKDPSQPQQPLVAHADVRRMLLAQKSYAEGGLGLVLTAPGWWTKRASRVRPVMRRSSHRENCCSTSSPRSPRAGRRSGAWPGTTSPSRCMAVTATRATTKSSSCGATTGSTRSTKARMASRASTCSAARWRCSMARRLRRMARCSMRASRVPSTHHPRRLPMPCRFA
jgi:alkylation response protein AidB-like acyl-CoA dehydrogenase